VYREITVKHFRAFDDIKVPLAPITLLSGRNNTGKTALLEALFLHTAGPLAAHIALTVLRPARGQGPIVINDIEGGSAWDSLFHNYDMRTPIRLSGRFNNEAVSVTLSPSKDPSSPGLPQSVGSSSQTFAQSIYVTFRRGQHKSEHYTQSASQQIFGQPISGLYNVQVGGINLQVQPQARAFVVSYYLTGRTRSTPADLAARYSEMRVREKSADFLQAIREIEPRLRALEVLVRDGQPALYADIGGPDLLPLSVFGEGMTAAADFLSAIYISRGGVVFIDEVENGIHYSVLGKVWQRIGQASRQTNTQVIATTHSRECLEAARSALGEQKRDLGLIRLWRDPKDHEEPGRIKATTYDSEEINDALNFNLDLR
jgi:hypothetical protein